MKVLLADDHPLFREGIRHILAQLDPAITMVEAHTVREALELIEGHDDIELILLDLNMPGADGFDGFQRIWCANPTLPIVILSASEEPRDIETAMELGAAGYIPKSSTSRTMLSALNLVLEGGTYSPRIAVGQRRGGESVERALSKRQRQVLKLMADGLSNKAIAEQLFISEATVKGHVSTIFQTLEVDNRVQAINKGKASGEI